MAMTKLESGIVALLIAAGVAPGAAGAGDLAQGRDLAQRWCASCHAIALGEASDEEAPSFESIVRGRGRSSEWIATWLSTPHEMMPDLTLTREEIAALVAYFDSLRPTN
jgi:mono/diheme cytochrome c family protein